MQSPRNGNDQSLRRIQDDRLASPSSPAPQPGMSASQLSTPIMSQQRAKALVLDTPPGFSDGENIASMSMFSLPNAQKFKTAASIPQQTPALMIISSQHDNTVLEPPAWKPPEADEIEYTDAWNNTYNNQHHYLQPFGMRDDSSIGSNLTNNSLLNTSVICNTSMALRPRGYSCSLTSDAHSIGSCPQAQRGGGGHPSHHRRHPSLPISIFSSTSHHVFVTEQNKRYLHALQPTKKNNPYELNSDFNRSQVQADGAKAGLVGTILDLYMIDRMVDCASAKMLATTNDAKMNAHESVTSVMNSKQSNVGSKSSSSRKTSLGTVDDIRCILELYKVDRIVDRFKHDLQMPQFFEDEAWEESVWTELRKTDVEIENMKLKAMEHLKDNEEKPCREKSIPQFPYDDCCNDGEKREGSEVGEGFDGGACASTGSSFHFFDPHETNGLQAHSYHHSKVTMSISDDLHDVIELLRTDFEVDGASRRHKELEMIMPLLVVDQEMNKMRVRSETKDMWDTDLKALYLIDLEVDDAKVRCLRESSSKRRGEDSLPRMKSSEQLTNEEVKEILSRHIPQGPQQIFQSPPAAKGTLPPPDLALPPPVPMSSPQASTNYMNCLTQGKANTTIVPATTIAKRSIFSSRERASAASQCGFHFGVMAPGTTTTVVVGKGGEMIDDIPIGKVVMR